MATSTPPPLESEHATLPSQNKTKAISSSSVSLERGGPTPGWRTASVLFILVNLADDDRLERQRARIVPSVHVLHRHKAATTVTTALSHHRHCKTELSARHRRLLQLLLKMGVLQCCWGVGVPQGGAAAAVAALVVGRFALVLLPEGGHLVPGAPEGGQVQLVHVRLHLGHVDVGEVAEVAAPEAHLAAGRVALPDAHRVAPWTKGEMAALGEGVRTVRPLHGRRTKIALKVERQSVASLFAGALRNV